jgi:hypothetical protein
MVVLLLKVMELCERWSSVERRGTGEGGRMRPSRLQCITLPLQEHPSGQGGFTGQNRAVDSCEADGHELGTVWQL